MNFEGKGLLKGVSLTVGSEIFYQCQTGVLPEERMILLCGEDGRWNPNPQGLCKGKKTTSLDFFIIILQSDSLVLFLFQRTIYLQQL